MTGLLPRHIAVIMDGNGRWANRRGLLRFEGHKAGAEAARKTVEFCRERGIRYLTLFSFSTENWHRPAREVSSLMALFKHYLDSEIDKLLDNDIRLRAVGDLERLPTAVRSSLKRDVERTKDKTGLDLIIAISYGGREEIVAAARKLAAKARDGLIRPEQIDSADFASALWTADIPDPDLLIRTSGEMRISNFLLWQLAYSEIVVAPELWPDFGKDTLDRCLQEYSRRERRFGLAKDQPVEQTEEKEVLRAGSTMAS